MKRLIIYLILCSAYCISCKESAKNADTKVIQNVVTIQFLPDSIRKLRDVILSDTISSKRLVLNDSYGHQAFLWIKNAKPLVMRIATPLNDEGVADNSYNLLLFNTEGLLTMIWDKQLDDQLFYSKSDLFRLNSTEKFEAHDWLKDNDMDFLQFAARYYYKWGMRADRILRTVSDSLNYSLGIFNPDYACTLNDSIRCFDLRDSLGAFYKIPEGYKIQYLGPEPNQIVATNRNKWTRIWVLNQTGGTIGLALSSEVFKKVVCDQ